MKKITLIITIIVTLFLALPCTAEIYPLITTIKSIDRNLDLVYCVDQNGNKWAFYGANNQKINDILLMIMNDNNSWTIKDDIIKTVYYRKHINAR